MRGAAFAAGVALLKRSRDAVLAGVACAGDFQGNAVRGLIRPPRHWIFAEPSDVGLRGRAKASDARRNIGPGRLNQKRRAGR